MPVRYRGGGSSGGVATPNPLDALGPLTITAADTNAVPIDAFSATLTATFADVNAVPTDTATLRISGLTDTNAVPVDARTATLRSYASGCVDNDTGKTTPANANGQQDGVTAAVKTGNAIGDLTNPVTLTSGSMNWPGGTLTGATTVRLYFSFGANAAAADTATITFNDGAGHSGTAWASTAVAEDHLSQANSLVFTLPAATVLTSLVLTASYTAAVVAAPTTVIHLDAWAIEAGVVL